jgi:hypothetical protein
MALIFVEIPELNPFFQKNSTVFRGVIRGRSNKTTQVKQP